MTIVHLSEDLAQRLAVEAARRGMTVDEVAAEALAAPYPHPGHKRTEGA